jgi:hypothetical protein
MGKGMRPPDGVYVGSSLCSPYTLSPHGKGDNAPTTHWLAADPSVVFHPRKEGSPTITCGASLHLPMELRSTQSWANHPAFVICGFVPVGAFTGTRNFIANLHGPH